jgi:hypothetical protein
MKMLWKGDTMEGDNKSGINKRKYVRLERNFMMSYREKGSGEEFDMTNINNISKGGLFFYSNTYYPVETLLELLISFPFRIGKERVNVCAIVRAARKEGKGTYGIGVEFLKMDEEVKKELYSFIEFLKKKGHIET